MIRPSVSKSGQHNTMDALSYRLQEAMTEESIESELRKQAAIKSGKFVNENAYRGYSQRDTELVRSIANKGNAPTTADERAKYFEQQRESRLNAVKQEEKKNQTPMEAAMDYMSRIDLTNQFKEVK